MKLFNVEFIGGLTMTNRQWLVIGIYVAMVIGNLMQWYIEGSPYGQLAAIWMILGCFIYALMEINDTIKKF